MFPRRPFIIGFALLCLTAVAGCDRGDGTGEAGGSGDKIVSLNGAGATFPYPLYSKWMSEYNKLHPNIRINYQSIGSGGGIRQIIAGTVDFGATDAAMEASEEKQAPRKLVHIPTTLGAVAVTYNLPDVKSEVRLTPDTIAGIFLGDITKWNDPKIAEANPGVALPDRLVKVVYRSDGSGTTAVFTDYLAAISGAWKGKVGAGKSVKWPTGLGAKGNEGVTGQVKVTPGGVGYVELAYALQNKMPVAAVQNQAGQFVTPQIDAITAAAKGAEMPDTLHRSIVNAPGEGAYPIAAYTYILVYEELKDPQKGQALAEFLWWAVHDGQKYAEELHYAPLPATVVAKVEKRLKELKVGGKPAL
jgi:phosphate transport system substrate-binding protein